MRVDVYIHQTSDPNPKLDQILDMLTKGIKGIMADLTSITTAVNDEVTVEESAITLITGLASQITALKTDPVALQALADQLNAEKDKLAAAVAANTAPAPAPAPAPGP